MQSSGPTTGCPSLKHLVLREVCAVALAVAALLSCPLIYQLSHQKLSTSAIVALCVSMIAVIAFMAAFTSRTEKQIRSGIAAELWPQAEVEHVRGILDSRWVVFASRALAFGAVAGWLLSLITSNRLAGLFAGIALMLTGFANSLKVALTPAKPTGLPNIWRWRTWRGITSDHWGER